MILRRVIQHVRTQEWTAIAIDLVIVVLGVLLAMQVNNWNEARAASKLEQRYLERLATDMRSMLQKLDVQQARGEKQLSACGALIRILADPASPESSLFEAMRMFYEKCWFTPDFRPVDTAFQDLTSTGNLQLIRDTGLRDAIIALYQSYRENVGGIQTNKDWLLASDSRLTYEHDVMRWDRRVAAQYPPWSDEDMLASVRSGRKSVERVAASYYAATLVAQRTVQMTKDQTSTVLGKIEAELERR